MNALQRITIIESCISQNFQVLRQGDRLQRGTVSECRSSNFRNRIGNIHCHQTGTICECTATNLRQALRQCQIPQIGTAVKRTIANGQNIVLHNHSPQAVLVLECIVTNGCDIVAVQHQRDGQRGRIPLIAGDRGIVLGIQGIGIDHHGLALVVVSLATAAAAHARAIVAGAGARQVAGIANGAAVAGGGARQFLSGTLSDLSAVLIMEADLHRTTRLVNHIIAVA